MKFAKELEDDLVPEWRIKYFNYKIGKKKIKAVSRALRSANKSPQATLRDDDQLPFTHYDFNRRHEQSPLLDSPQHPQHQTNGSATRSQAVARASTDSQRPRPVTPFDRRQSITMFARSPPVLMGNRSSEEQPKIEEEAEDVQDNNVTQKDQKHHHHHHHDDHNQDERGDSDLSSDSDNPREDGDHQPDSGQNRPRYGSIVGTPPEQHSPDQNLTALHLPDPALDPSKRRPGTSYDGSHRLSPRVSRATQAPTDVPSYWERQPKENKLTQLPNLPQRLFKKRGKRKNDSFRSSTKMKRAFTSFAMDSPAVSTSQFEALRDLDARQEEFFTFLDKELSKIEKFYKMKEEEASSRLQALREQLHEMRDRRLQDLQVAQKGGKVADDGFLDGQIPVHSTPHQNGKLDHSMFKPVADIFNTNGKIGKTSKAREDLASPRGSISKQKTSKNDRGDYVRKQQPHEKVPYRFAKRKLKLALQEFYRGLELLKSYALLNRTAFRKINKKYDKAVMARPPLRYMSEKVNNAHFVQSTLVEETLVSIEDLYARYFERGNRKIAVNKLRSHLRSGEHSQVTFRNGLYVAAGVGLAVSGLVNGVKHLYSDDPIEATKASYLFQFYAGYLLAVLLFLFFVLDCRTWTRNRINYTFVFEYDTRHTLDWRQLAEIPCFFLFLNGLFFWLNFQFHDEHILYLYWPIFLVGFTVIVIFLPFKVLYYHARKWFLYSNWRLLLAGLYPVEFRDFYLGDMYCSETYAMSQLEVFFCVYAHRWDRPQQCNSNHSRLLGFLTTLPAIWRALQCLRRYYDSKNWFPHLANFAKYMCNILYYMSLSLYRIKLDGQMRAMFITFALVNGLYCAFWDVFMDFSLGNPWSKNFLLRDNLAFRRKWYYYGIMITDFLLRQQWVFYAIFTEDLQHSAVMSFFVSLAEVIRRGLWSLFRVENEHCNNVEKFRASRDIPLPYSVPDSRAGSVDYSRRAETGRQSPESTRTDVTQPGAPRRSGISGPSTTDLERQATSTSSLRHRGPFAASTPGISALQRVGTAIAAAHTQDFQKKSRVEVVGRSDDTNLLGSAWTDDEDDDYDDNASRADYEEQLQRERYLDSREDLSPRNAPARNQEDGGGDDEDSGSPGASNSANERGEGNRRPRNVGSRQERDLDALRRAQEEDDAEIGEARDTIDRARHQ